MVESREIVRFGVFVNSNSNAWLMWR